MSASAIIKELPKLSEAKYRDIREGLLEIANQELDEVRNALKNRFSI